MTGLYGKVLRAARQSNGVSRGELAAFLGVVPSMISMIETGQRGAHEPIQELADFLDADLDYLLAAWKLSQPKLIQLHTEDRAGRRFWFHHVAKREGLGITQQEFDQMMVEHVDPDHLKGRR